MKRRFGILCFLWLTCQTLVGLGVGYAQESGSAAQMDTGQSELAYFLGQQDSTKTTGSKLQAQMDELQKKYAADPNAGLREQIREREAFTSKLQDLFSEAQKFVDPVLLPTLDLLAHDVRESASSLGADLNARLRASNPDRIALKGQIDKAQKEIDLNNKLAKILADKVKSMQDDHRREGVGSELDALTKVAGSGVISGTSPAVARPDPEKEH